MAKSQEYLLLPNAGIHRMKDGTKVLPGESIESERELDKVYPGKFAPMTQAAPKKKHKQAKKKKDGGDSGLESERDEVTSTFEGADTAGVRVFKNGRKFDVEDADDGEKVVEDPVGKKAVQNIIADRLEDDDEEDDDE
jgi:hypothetical protein